MYINTTTGDYPLTLRQIRQAVPNVSLSKQPDESTLNAMGFATVQPTSRPAGDVVTEGQPEQQPEGMWAQTWDVRAYTTEEATAALSRAKEQAFERINVGYDIDSRAMVASYPEREIGTFGKQESEARAWLADNTAVTPFLDGLMLTRAITKTDLANRIVAKADALADAAGQLTGKRQTLEGQVEAATAIADVEVIAW